MATKRKAASAEGKWAQLKDATGSFVDPITGWQLTRAEVAPWPENPGALTAEFIQKGHIIEADAPTDAPTDDEAAKTE